MFYRSPRPIVVELFKLLVFGFGLATPLWRGQLKCLGGLRGGKPAQTQLTTPHSPELGAPLRKILWARLELDNLITSFFTGPPPIVVELFAFL